MITLPQLSQPRISSQGPHQPDQRTGVRPVQLEAFQDEWGSLGVAGGHRHLASVNEPFPTC
jgi:hypothetical protein